MITRRQLHDAAGQAASQITFIDPSARCRQKVRITAALMTALVPHLNDSPALSTTGERLGPALTAATTGKRVLVVGEGSLVRILEINRENGQTIGLDPSTKRFEARFTPAELKHIGRADT